MIQQAYENGLRVREEGWDKTFWIKKYSYTQSIDEMGRIWDNKWDLENNHEDWEIWAEDEHLFNQPDIKAQIQTHLNQIQELLKQL